MSYTILYRTMFVKVDNDRFIPLYESGDNNVWECDLKRRARSWGHWLFSNLNGDRNRLPFFTEHELLKMAEGVVKDEVYYGTKVSGRSCTDEKDLMNYWQRAIRKAKTFEELTEADITLKVKDCNSYYDKDAPHFSKAVTNLEELVVAWGVCLATCGTAECVPLYDVNEWAWKRLYPTQPKVIKPRSEGYVVKFGYQYVSRMTPRHLHYTQWMEYGHKYSSRSAAQDVVERIKKRYTQITETPEVIHVRKNENDRWEQAA